MVEDPTPASSDGNTVAKGDFLALSVLAGNVPVPLAQTGAGFSGFYAPAPLAPNNPPAPSPNGLAGGQGSATGLMLMLSADIDPLGGGGGGGAGGGGAPAPAPMSMVAPAPAAMRRPLAIDPTAGQLRGTTASVPLVCQLTSACKGTLVLQDRPAARAAAAAGKARKPGGWARRASRSRPAPAQAHRLRGRQGRRSDDLHQGHPQDAQDVV
jgi:hypothetical protein